MRKERKKFGNNSFNSIINVMVNKNFMFLGQM